MPFLYKDFREGWKEGQAKARSLGIYRQNYCGCIFSEYERFAARPEKKGNTGLHSKAGGPAKQYGAGHPAHGGSDAPTKDGAKKA